MFLAVTAMMGNVPEQTNDLVTLGAYVRSARLLLKRSKDDLAATAGMSPVTWTRVEDGKPVRALTYAGIEQALGWTPGSCARFLKTGEAPPVVDEVPAEAATARPFLETVSDAQLLTELVKRFGRATAIPTVGEIAAQVKAQLLSQDRSTPEEWEELRHALAELERSSTSSDSERAKRIADGDELSDAAWADAQERIARAAEANAQNEALEHVDRRDGQ